MGNIELQREVRGLVGDINMTKMAVTSIQNDMKSQLSGGMGEDITAVLNGERVVKAPFTKKQKHRITTWLKRLFRMF